MSVIETPDSNDPDDDGTDWVGTKGAFGIPGEVILLKDDLEDAIAIIGSSVPFESLFDDEIDWPDHLPRLPNLVKLSGLDEGLIDELVERIASAARNSRLGNDSDVQLGCGCDANGQTPSVHPAEETAPSSEHPIEAEPVKSQPVKSQPVRSQPVRSQPDPHTATLHMSYQLDSPGQVMARLYNISGMLVGTWLDLPALAGDHQVEVSFPHSAGNGPLEGIYVMQMIHGNRSYSKKMIISY